MTEVKAVDDRVEAFEKTKYEEHLPLPESLSRLSETELLKGRRTTIKLDLSIMPAITILYILNYLDRQNIAANKLANITEDLGHSTT